MKQGRFLEFGGQYIPETLMTAVQEVEKAYNHYKNDPQFLAELKELYQNYAGRPSLLYYAKKMTEDLGGAKIYLKREDLNHTGSHKINNVLGQMLLAKKLGKTRVIAETGAGQHGVATATVAALMGMECEIFMGREDTKRQALNVYRMELLGAKVHPVDSGTATLKDAVNETMREWTRRMDDTFYVLGSVMGPHPFPTMVRDFQSVIGKEMKQQLFEKEGCLPNVVIACVGGGSNAIGAFYEFIPDSQVALIGCEAAGHGVHTKQNAATIANGTIGIFHGMKSLFCQDEYGQIAPVYSISAGLDYPGIGPEHAMLFQIGRASYAPVTDEEAVLAFEYLSKMEGIIPAIESAHAIAYAKKIASTMSKDQIIVINVSGRGDKDVSAIARYRGGSYMSRISKALAGKKSFVAFLTGGDPSIETTEQLIIAMAEEGVDLIEIGIPFSDPIAEGPVIQAANERALSNGCTTDLLFEMVERVRKTTTVPLCFMTYINPVFTYGKERFMKRCKEVGVDGIIVPDLPYEEKEELEAVCDHYEVDLISMITPTSKQRIIQIAKDAKGFLYCVSSLGVTGVRSSITTNIKVMVSLAKETTDIPCFVGFGISNPQQVASMSKLSDGVIVGSAIVRIIEQYKDESIPYVRDFVRTMKPLVNDSE